MIANIRTLLVLFSALCGISASENVIICYYGTWATYRPGLGQFSVENVHPHLCTHLIYGFVGIDELGTVISLDPYLDLETGRDNFRNFNAIKQKNPELKTLLGVGGWNEGSEKYSVMSANTTLRQNFISSALHMVLDYGFDGFDLDWEYPNQRDTVHGTDDIDNFSILCKEMKEEFDNYGLLLTAAVAATKASAVLSYDIPTIAKYLDFINVLTYDMHGPWDNQTGHNAPLHMSEGDSGVAEEMFTVDVSIEYWLEQGCPPEKLVLGLPFYGHTFNLTSANESYVGAPALGAGIAGPYTGEAGTLGYNEFCVELQTGSWEKRRDELGRVPYAVNDIDWVSYDDPQSLVEKVNFSKSLGLAGVMVWSIESDDFHGQCGESYGLLKAINEALGNTIPTEPITEAAQTTVEVTGPVIVTSEATTAGAEETDAPVVVPEGSTGNLNADSSTETLGGVEISTHGDITELCKKVGITSNPKDCSSFIFCSIGDDGKLIANILECPATLLWDANVNSCNYPQFVKCTV